MCACVWCVCSMIMATGAEMDGGEREQWRGWPAALHPHAHCCRCCLNKQQQRDGSPTE
jgi:hypothetical protein